MRREFVRRFISLRVYNHELKRKKKWARRRKESVRIRSTYTCQRLHVPVCEEWVQAKKKTRRSLHSLLPETAFFNYVDQEVEGIVFYGFELRGNRILWIRIEGVVLMVNHFSNFLSWMYLFSLVTRSYKTSHQTPQAGHHFCRTFTCKRSAKTVSCLKCPMTGIVGSRHIHVHNEWSVCCIIVIRVRISKTVQDFGCRNSLKPLK